ncbi:MAG: YkgJ family cysteine cluster protein [Desulfobacteraceae bacterium]|nr:MAG: YkgJ family cysteine cluster protein [Desulfobacteraceae bacterium]
MSVAKSQCQTCGACCAFYRVIFPSCEISNPKTFSVPINMTQQYDLSQSIMKGTESETPRCMALIGNVGFNVSCSIYHNRSSTCRKFEQSWKKNLGNRLCDKARSVYGLQPFSQY